LVAPSQTNMDEDGREWSFKTAAIHLLKLEKKPLSAKQLTSEILRQGTTFHYFYEGMVKSSGKTPDRTVASLIYSDIKGKGKDSQFIGFYFHYNLPKQLLAKDFLD
jgi:hypothetical protein